MVAPSTTYDSTETGTALIYVRPFPNVNDGLWNVSLAFGVSPVWSPDGRELFYQGGTGTTAREGRSISLMVAQIETEPTFSAQTPEPLLGMSGYAPGNSQTAARAFDLTPDGDRFIFRKLGTAGQTSDDEPFNGLVFVENWFEELKERVPVN